VLNITCRSLRLRVAKRMQSVGTFASWNYAQKYVIIL
jgi:hypothetical protein